MFKKLCLLILCPLMVTLWAKTPVNITFEYNDNIINKIIVRGTVSKTEWLGISLYPKDVKDAIKDGHHITQEISPDSFQYELAIDDKQVKRYNSSYEIALWGKKIYQKDCTVKNCYWCKTNGFHLDEFLFYQTGYFNVIPSKK